MQVLGIDSQDVGNSREVRESFCRGDEASSTACLVCLLCANEHSFFPRGGALSSVCRVSAHNADCERFGDIFRDCEKLRHWLKGLTPVILVKASDDDALSVVSELFCDINNAHIEELCLIDADDVRRS